MSTKRSSPTLKDLLKALNKSRQKKKRERSEEVNLLRYAERRSSNVGDLKVVGNKGIFSGGKAGKQGKYSEKPKKGH